MFSFHSTRPPKPRTKPVSWKSGLHFPVDMLEMNTDQEGVQVVKALSMEQVLRIVRENYDVVPFTAKALPGWVDKNFQIQTLTGQSTENKDYGLPPAVYTLKILNAKESKELDFVGMK